MEQGGVAPSRVQIARLACVDGPRRALPTARQGELDPDPDPSTSSVFDVARRVAHALRYVLRVARVTRCACCARATVHDTCQ